MIAQPRRNPAGDDHPVERVDQQGALRLTALPRAIGCHDLGQFGIKIARRRSIMLQHVAQHQCVRQSVGQMMKTAERIGQSMHPRDRRIGKGDPGEMRPEQHCRSGGKVVGMIAGPQQVRRQQPQRLFC